MKEEAKKRQEKAFAVSGIILGAIFALTLLGSPEVAHAKSGKHKHRNYITVECGDTIGPGKRIFLGNDLDCSDYSGGEVALTVVGPVLLDLDNHTITGNANMNGRYDSGEMDGIVVKGTKARIRRGAVTGFYNGVVLEGEGDHRLLKVHANDNEEDGFVVETSNNRLTFTRAVNNGDNGYEINGDLTWLIKSRAQDNEDEGIYISSNENQIFMNRSVNNRFENIEINGDSNRVFHNKAKDGRDRGIDVEGNDNHVHKNKSMNNVEHGISVDGDANKITKNRSFNNAWHGIVVESGNIDNVIDLNYTRDNGHADPSRYFDVYDQNQNCTDNTWGENGYGTGSPDCIP